MMDEHAREHKCDMCGVKFYEGTSAYEAFSNTSALCGDCFIKCVKEISTVAFDYFSFVEEKCPDEREFIEELKKQNFEQLAGNFIKDNNVGDTIYFLSADSVSKKDYLTLFSKIFTDKCKNNLYKALWNSFLKRNPDLESEPKYVTVVHACKRCGNSYDAHLDYDTYIQIKNDPSFICQQCEVWLAILRDFELEYGHMLLWSYVISDLRQLSFSGKQANPTDFYRILRSHNIEMSDQIVNFWNKLFDKHNGNGIIKCYAVPDSVSGAVQQSVLRVLGGIFGSKNIR